MSREMSVELWGIFIAKLERAGYSMDDIADCSDQVFLSVVSELGGFTALQTAKLQTEIKRRRNGSAASSRQTSRAGTPTFHSGSALYTLKPSTAEYDSIQQVVATILFNSGITSPVVQISKWSDASNVTLFLNHQRTLHDPTTAPLLKWKWISVAEYQQLLQRGDGMLLPDMTPDELCPSGLVLYSDRSSAPPCSQSESAVGYVLIGVETTLGKTKLMDESDSRLLQGFPMQRCFNSLHQDGYDSLQILRSNGATDAVVVFSSSQVLIKYFVKFQTLSDECQGSTSSCAPGSLAADLAAAAAEDVNMAMPATNTTFARSGSLSAPNNSNSNDMVALRCPTHPTKMLEFWCPEERKLICSHCLFHCGYNKKTCSLIEDAAAVEVHDLQGWARNAATFLRDIRSVEKMFDAAVSEVEETVHRQIDDVRETFHSLRRAIDSAEEFIVTELTTKSREQVVKIQQSAAMVAKRVGDVDDVYNKAAKVLQKDRLEGPANIEVLQLIQKAWMRWDVLTIPSYSIPVANMKALPSSSSIAAAVTTSVASAEATVCLPEAIDVNYLQALK